MGDGSNATGVSINFLGPATIELNGSEDSLSPQKATLLALLAVRHGTWVPVDELIDQGVADTFDNLTTAISRLRSSLGDRSPHKIIETQAGFYRLSADCRLDTTEWESLITEADRRAPDDSAAALRLLADARNLWRGRPYDGFADVPALADEANRLLGKRVDAGLTEGLALSGAGRAADAGALLQALAKSEPLREDVATAAVRALHEAGRPLEANDVAAGLRVALMELGYVPGASFEAAERHVRGGDAFEPGMGSPPAARPGLVALIVDRVGDMLAGIVNPVMRIPCPLDFDLGQLVVHLDLAIQSKASSHVVQPRRGATHTLRGVASPSQLADFQVGQAAEHRMMLATLAKLAHIDPLVILVENSEQLDSWSAALVSAIESATPQIPNLALVALEGSGSLPEPAARGAHRRSPDLPPMTPEAAESAVRWHYPRLEPGAASELAVELTETFDGETLWIEQALYSGQPRRPTVATLSPATWNTLAVAAVLGFEVDANLLSACLGQSVDATLQQIGSGLDAKILVARHTPGIWSFASEDARTQAQARLGLDQHLGLHMRAGTWLREKGRVLEAAEHLLSAIPAIDIEEAMDVIEQSGQLLLEGGSYSEAAERFELARTLTDRTDLQASLDFHRAAALELLGLHPEASALLDEVIAQAAAHGNLDLIAKAALAGVGEAGKVGGLSARRTRLALARPRLPAGHPDADQIAIELVLEKLTSRSDVEDDLLEHVRRVAQTPDNVAFPIALKVVLVDEQIRHGASFADAKTLANRVTHGAETISVSDRVSCLAAAIHVALECGRWSDAEDWIGEMRLLGDQRQNPRGRWQARAFKAALEEARGHHDLADASSAEALAIGQQLGLADAETTFGLHLVGKLFVEGDLAILKGDLPEQPGRYNFPFFYILRGLVELEAGYPEAAQRELELAESMDFDSMEVFRLATLAAKTLLAVRLGVSVITDQLAPELDTRAGRLVFLGYGGPFLGPVDWYRSLIAPSPELAEDYRRSSQELCEQVRARAWLTGSRASYQPG